MDQGLVVIWIRPKADYRVKRRKHVLVGDDLVSTRHHRVAFVAYGKTNARARLGISILEIRRASTAVLDGIRHIGLDG